MIYWLGGGTSLWCIEWARVLARHFVSFLPLTNLWKNTFRILMIASVLCAHDTCRSYIHQDFDLFKRHKWLINQFYWNHDARVILGIPTDGSSKLSAWWLRETASWGGNKDCNLGNTSYISSFLYHHAACHGIVNVMFLHVPETVLFHSTCVVQTGNGFFFGCLLKKKIRNDWTSLQ